MGVYDQICCIDTKSLHEWLPGPNTTWVIIGYLSTLSPSLSSSLPPSPLFLFPLLAQHFLSSIGSILMVVMEFIEGGSLRGYLEKVKVSLCLNLELRDPHQAVKRYREKIWPHLQWYFFSPTVSLTAAPRSGEKIHTNFPQVCQTNCRRDAVPG